MPLTLLCVFYKKLLDSFQMTIYLKRKVKNTTHRSTAKTNCQIVKTEQEKGDAAELCFGETI